MLAMNEHLIADLTRFVDGRGVTISESPGHVKLGIVRSDVSLSVLIPRGVLEWWVEINDSSGAEKIQDWCDYAGYGATTPAELSESMRTDVLTFVENVLVRPLRVDVSGSALEWNVGGDWLQAVPLVTHTQRGRHV